MAKSNEQFEGLAEAIFNYENDHFDSPIAIWEDQNSKLKQRYIVAAMTAKLITLGPIWKMEIFPTTSKESEEAKSE